MNENVPSLNERRIVRISNRGWYDMFDISFSRLTFGYVKNKSEFLEFLENGAPRVNSRGSSFDSAHRRSLDGIPPRRPFIHALTNVVFWMAG